MTSGATLIPAGYVPHTRHSPLTDPWEPIFARTSDSAVCLAVEVREAHCNSRGFAHGGLIAALADNAMGLSAARVASQSGELRKSGLTVSLTLDFIGSAAPGDWLEIRPVVLKCGGTLAFVECHVRCGEHLIARGSATFRIA